ncbi:unnamed protein product [Rotaria sp. Silwood2]|nr:unnamed protein product [Rotaria sp. Silwood2]CAF4125179.1 unnamed protein product [Rotaria sp. Silwood2]
MATITFDVAKVDICTIKHTTAEYLIESDLARWTLKDQKLSLENFQINHPLAADLNGDHHRIANAFVASAFKAYCEYYPFELSVEDIWIVIAQGISIHLNENAEKYREPKYGNKSVPAIDWSAAVRQMGQLIRSDMRIDLATLLTTPFSSTTSIE